MKMHIRLFVSLLLFGILTACGGGGGGSSATDTSTSTSPAPQMSVARVADATRTDTQFTDYSTATDLEYIRTQLTRIAHRSLTEAEIDAVLVILNGRLTTQYCENRKKVLSDDGLSCVTPTLTTPTPPATPATPTASSCNEVQRWSFQKRCVNVYTLGNCLDNNQVVNEAMNGCRAITTNDCSVTPPQTHSRASRWEWRVVQAECYRIKFESLGCSAGQTLNADKTACRDIITADCSWRERLVGNTCQTCPDANGRMQRANADHTECRAFTQADCDSLYGTGKQVLKDSGDDGRTPCKRALPSYCTANQTWSFSERRCISVALQDTCASMTPPQIINEANNGCRPVLRSDCSRSYEWRLSRHEEGYERALPKSASIKELEIIVSQCKVIHSDASCSVGKIYTGDRCRDLTLEDCQRRRQIFVANDDGVKVCKSCSGDTPNFDGNFNRCEPRHQTCLDQNLELINGVCAQATDMSCRSISQRLHENGKECRLPTDAECRADNNKIRNAWGHCYKLTQQHCQRLSQVLHSNGRECIDPPRSDTSTQFVELLSDEPTNTANSFLQVDGSDPIRLNWYGTEININPYYYYDYNTDLRSKHVSFSALRHLSDDITAYTGMTSGKDKDLYLLGLDWRDYRFIVRNHDAHDIHLYGMGYSTQINQSDYRIGFEYGSDNLTSGHFLWNYQF